MKIQELVPELLVEDMTKTLQFYQKIIGFKVEIAFPEKKPIFVQIKKESARIMLYLRSDFQKEIAKLKKIKMGGSTLLYFRAKKIIGLESIFVYFFQMERVYKLLFGLLDHLVNLSLA